MKQQELYVKLDKSLIKAMLKFVKLRYTLSDVRYVEGVGIKGISEVGRGPMYTIFLPHILLVNIKDEDDWRGKLGDQDDMKKVYKVGQVCKEDFINFFKLEKSYIQG